MTNPRVVIQIVEGRDLHYYSDGGPVEILIIDETCPSDRVYRLSHHVADPGTIDNLIGDAHIGKLGDMPNVEQQIRDHVDGAGKPKSLN
jgi:hypothetical protein